MPANKAVFLDRDGIINIDKVHVHRVQDFEFVEGIFDLCRFFLERSFDLYVITNQAGIAKKLYTLSDFNQLNDWMLSKFDEKNITIKKVYFCPHHPNDRCDCRKPEPGMVLRAQQEFDLDLSQSVLIGDKNTDIEAGIRAGIGYNFLVGENTLHQITIKESKNILVKHLDSLNDLMKDLKINDYF